jgi:hypothetical protein
MALFDRYVSITLIPIVYIGIDGLPFAASLMWWLNKSPRLLRGFSDFREKHPKLLLFILLLPMLLGIIKRLYESFK